MAMKMSQGKGCSKVQSMTSSWMRDFHDSGQMNQAAWILHTANVELVI
jgi:hypothetical protein